MQKNWKESEFFKKLKHIRVNRAVYLSAIIVLLSISVVLIVTAVNNRANKPSVNTTTPPPVTEVPKPQETTPPPQTNENDKPTQGNTIPEFALPVGGVLSQKHSVDTQVFSPTLNEYRVHLGIDIATEEAAPVFAMAPGTVAQIWEDPMMGWSLAISHTGDAVTVYKNLSKQFAEGITIGAEVEAGQLLGSVGDTAMIEIAEEPHLHVEMTVKGLQVDPLEYFSQEVLSALTEDSIYESETGK
jgi:murein DD-endopeptidase MepM/ murein hydrolase activator NlpD